MEKGKRVVSSSIAWGIVLIIGAVLLILNALDVLPFSQYGLGPWKLCLGALLVGISIQILLGRKPALLFLPLAGLFLVFEEAISNAVGKGGENLIPTWVVIVAAVLLWLGTEMVIPKRLSTAHGIFHNGGISLYLDAEKDLQDAHVHDIAGSASVYMTNQDLYPGNGRLTVEDIAGKVTIYLPAQWRLFVHCSDVAGRVHVPKQPEGEYEKSLQVEVRDVAGSVDFVLENQNPEQEAE
ncbi:MAG: hypothetical protein IJU20_07270 [Clostridia bacterium]|nr:hypothetical protein [Clostridia bacterium]